MRFLLRITFWLGLVLVLYLVAPSAQQTVALLLGLRRPGGRP